MIEPITRLSPSRRDPARCADSEATPRITRWLAGAALMLGCVLAVGVAWTLVGDLDALTNYLTVVGHTLARAE